MGVLQFPEIRDSLSKKKFDCLFDAMIIDEASKTTFQEFLVPAMFSRKWIISGDPKQLSPYADREFIETQIENLIKSEYHLENSQKKYEDTQYVSLTAFNATRSISDGGNGSEKKALILLGEEQQGIGDMLEKQLRWLIRLLNLEALIHQVPDKWDNTNLEKLIINGSDIIISKHSLAKDFLTESQSCNCHLYSHSICSSCYTEIE